MDTHSDIQKNVCGTQEICWTKYIHFAATSWHIGFCIEESGGVLLKEPYFRIEGMLEKPWDEEEIHFSIYTGCMTKGSTTKGSIMLLKGFECCGVEHEDSLTIDLTVPKDTYHELVDMAYKASMNPDANMVFRASLKRTTNNREEGKSDYLRSYLEPDEEYPLKLIECFLEWEKQPRVLLKEEV